MSASVDTKTMILDTAQDMLQRQSMSGVSFQELANRVGIKKGSMYYHFESKESLSIAIVERAIIDLKESFRRGKDKTAVEQLNYFFSIYGVFLGVGEKICPGAAFAGEWENLTNPVKTKVNRLIEVQIEGVRQIIELGIKSGEFKVKDQPHEYIARWIISSIQGSLITCRILGKEQNFEAVVAVIKQFLGISK